ncbi:reverse transcriptase domain-containing protein [Tanacetum coccineum]
MVEERIKVAINPEYPEQTIMIGSTLTEEGHNKLCDLLQRNQDIFFLEACGYNRHPKTYCETSLERAGGMFSGIMKEVHYHDWLSNPVMVKKHDNSWRMCVDFKDLNKACPKDGYPLSEINWKVESLCGYPFKCILDAYKGYHQIQMANEDEEKTAFITSQGIFCYTKMPFGLRNTGATYQRLVDKAFHKQIGRNLEVYVDDLVIKSLMEDEIVKDIEETFKTLRKINMKLNPKKCTFRVEEGMFLGYKVNTRGLKLCPDKVATVVSLPSPKCLKDVQKLNGKLASLNRFLAKSAEKSLPFFKTLKKCMKKSDFHWIAEAEEAFKQMKQLIAELPMLATPMEKEELIVYLAAAKETVSAVLMTEREAKQMAIYFVSRALRDPEINYTSMEKLVLALVHTNGSRAGLVLTNPEGMEFTYALRFRFDATNNEAEYEALIAGLRIAEQMGVKNLQANVDSRLVANQVNGTYVAKEADIVRYLEKVRILTNNFKEFSIRQVPISENKKADALSKLASTSFAHLSKQVLVEELKEKSISEVEILAIVKEEGDTWMTPIFEYLTEETLPTDVKKARVWIEAKPVATITGNQIKKFVWDNIVCRFRLLGEIISNNVKQFRDNPFKDWCKKLCIRRHFASVKHPQTNGLVERANRSLGEGIKARLDAKNKNWLEELSHVLWAHRTMIKSNNRYTPFSLTYRTEAVIPAEIDLSILRTVEVDLEQNNEALEINLDLLEEKESKQQFVRQRAKQKWKKDTGKLGPKWEGPYEVTEALGKGAYKLRDRDRK